jgi:hypothetical protein
MQPDQSIEPTGGSRFCHSAFVSRWRLPPVNGAASWILYFCTAGLSEPSAL